MASEADLKVVGDLHGLQIEEYKSEAARMASNLTFLDLLQNNLEDGPLDDLVSILASSADMLGVEDTSEAAMDLALSDLRLRASKLPLKGAKFDTQMGREQKGLVKDIADLSRSEKAVEAAAAQNNQHSSLAKKCAFMAEKQKEYKRLADKYTLVLQRNGYRNDSSHDAVCKLSSDLRALRAQLGPLQHKLESYRGLPPSLELAQVKVAQAERHLENISDNLTREISTLHV